MSWMPGHDGRVALGVEPDRRVRRRAAAAPPDLGRAPHPAQQPVAARLAQSVPRQPSPQARRRGRSTRAAACWSTAARSPGRRRRGCGGAARAGPSRARGRARRSPARTPSSPPSRPGARNAFWARRFVFAGNVSARTSAQRYSVRAGMRTGNIQPPWPIATTASASIAVSVPSRRRAEADRLPRGARRPPSSCSAWRSLTSRTGRPVMRASSAAASASKPGALLGAEAAADELRPHADVVLPQPEGARELLAGGEHPLRRDPGGERVAVPRGDRRVRLERRLQLRGRLELELDRHVGGGERRLGVAAGVVGRARP